MKQKRRPLSVSLWAALAVPIALMVVIITALVSHITISRSIDSIQMLTGRLRGEINEHIVSHVQSFLDVPVCLTATSAELLGRGFLPAEDQQVLQRYFLHQIQQKPAITSLYFGNTSGGLADAGREGYGGSLYYIETEGFAASGLHKYGVDRDGNPGETVFRVDGFDARRRSWYTEAVEAGGPVISEPYVLATGQDMTVSVSRPVYSSSGELLGVTSSDIFLSHINTYLSTLKISPRGISFIVDEAGYLIASSAPEASTFSTDADGAARRLTALESPDRRISSAAERLLMPEETEIILDGEPWGMLVSTLNMEGRPAWRIVTLMPESDFTGPVIERLSASLGLIALAMILVLAAGLVIARFISAPIHRLGLLSMELANGRWLRAPEFHRIREVDEINRAFSDMSGKIEAMVESLNDEITERQTAEDEITRLLHEKDLLLKEVHHRIKNNMTTVRSLLYLQSGTVSDPEARLVLEDAVSRVTVMTEAYEVLNQSEGYEAIWIRRLISGILHTHTGVEVVKDVANLLLPTSMAIHVGIIVNELVTNCRKYAWPDGSGGAVHVSIGERKGGRIIEIRVSDSGSGIDGEVVRNKDFGTGLKIVEAMAEQYNGSVDIRNDGGTTVTVLMEKE